MLELILCSLVTILPDYLYRRYRQGRRFGKEITFFSVWYELRWGITGCLMLTIALITMIFYYHPSTTTAALYFRTIPILPELALAASNTWPPRREAASNSTTSWPRSAETRAASRPAGPPPGLVVWRERELDRLGVMVRTNLYAEAEDVRAENPDVVIVATGGLPDLEWLPGAEHCTSALDLLSGDVPLGNDVLVYDGTGRHPAPQLAELAQSQRCKVELVSLDAQLAQELTYAERAIWKRRLYELKVPMLFDHRLERVERRGNRLVAVLRNMLTNAPAERSAEQIIVEHGTLPVTELFEGLRSESCNEGVTNLANLVAGEPQGWQGEGFELHRIGDAVTSRNIQAATLDALRLCCVL